MLKLPVIRRLEYTGALPNCNLLQRWVEDYPEKLKPMQLVDKFILLIDIRACDALFGTPYRYALFNPLNRSWEQSNPAACGDGLSDNSYTNISFFSFTIPTRDSTLIPSKDDR
ncbi:MAG: hypothetical protein JMN27_16640 [gamma proteobacterium endosymbiont of Lamellibrachia anaximandri]|nr:hypothetical protein [gamma proteobacterium endosymbiont of Lamellibrachia anaximandri]MBL3535435.1 hypothetical protein [gamma proteobacterium endosymbiont of Lamellibrachia anaximandri]